MTKQKKVVVVSKYYEGVCVCGGITRELLYGTGFFSTNFEEFGLHVQKLNCFSLPRAASTFDQK